MSEQFKIRFNLQGTPTSGETVWAAKIEKDLYRLLNAPFFASGYAEGDIVRCEYHDGWLEVMTLVTDSGNGTLRLFFRDFENSNTGNVLDELVSVGCTYEKGAFGLVAVTVPPNLKVPFSQLSNYLNSLGKSTLLGWEIGKRFTRTQLG